MPSDEEIINKYNLMPDLSKKKEPRLWKFNKNFFLIIPIIICGIIAGNLLVDRIYDCDYIHITKYLNECLSHKDDWEMYMTAGNILLGIFWSIHPFFNPTTQWITQQKSDNVK